MSYTKKLKYAGLIRRFKNKKCQLKCYGEFKENRKKYKLYKIVINPKYRTRTLLITSGFHGEEFNGPISLLNIFDDIVAYAKKMRVRVIIYPCVNPSGFDLRKRYNASNECQNNDFMRYLIKDDKWVGTLMPGEKYLEYKIVDSPAREVRLLKKDVLRHKIPHGVLDIHQQKGNLDTGDFYAYIFDKRAVYKKIMNKLKKVAKIARNDPAMNFEDGREIYYKIDNDGFIVLHDCTMTDMFYRLGSKYVVTSETDTTMPLEIVSEINRIWIFELIKLISLKRG